MASQKFRLTADSASRISASVFTVILVLNVLAYRWFLYWRFRPFDMVMHTLGGLALGFFYLFLVLHKNEGKAADFWKDLLFVSVLSFAVFGGVVWELTEYFLKSYTLFPVFFHKARFFGEVGLKNTMSDLFFDALGGFGAALFSLLPIGYNKEAENSKQVLGNGI